MKGQSRTAAELKPGESRFIADLTDHSHGAPQRLDRCPKRLITKRQGIAMGRMAERFMAPAMVDPCFGLSRVSLFDFRDFNHLFGGERRVADAPK